MDNSTTAGTVGFTIASVATNTITITNTPTAEPPPPPPLPRGAVTVNRSWRYVEVCICPECKAHREGRLFFLDHTIVPAEQLTRKAPHEYPRVPPKPDTDAWREREARGSTLLRSLLSGEQLKVWDRFRALIIRYEANGGLCGCDDCNAGHITGLILTPERDREFGRWEFNQKGGLIHKRNLWAHNSDRWSYEDELISLLLAHRTDPKDFIGTGCRDRAGYYSSKPQFVRAERIMRRVGRLQEATKVPFARADQAGMFAGIY